MNLIIETKQVIKDYHQGGRKVRALNGIDMQISTGEFVSIMGHSGSGKSTFLHLLGALEYPTQGEILVDGADIARFKTSDRTLFRRRKIGLIFQFFNLVEELTALENILLPAKLDKKNPDPAFLDQLFDKLQIRDFLNAYPTQLSGGQQQRIAIARALSVKPVIILADEPTGNLDSRTAHETMELFTLCKQQFNQTILMVTHDSSIASYADRVIHFKDGEVLEAHL